MKQKNKKFLLLACSIIGLISCSSGQQSSSFQASENIISSFQSVSQTSETSSNIISSSENSSEISNSVETNYAISVKCEDCIVLAFSKTDLSSIKEGEIVKFEVTCNDPAKEIDKIIVSSESNSALQTSFNESSNEYSFVMPSENVTISVTTKSKKFFVRFNESPHISYSIIGRSESFEANEEVSFSASAFGGYKIGSITIKTASNKEVELTTSTYYKFVMPAEDVTISFEEIKLYEITTVSSEHISISITNSSTYYEPGNEIFFKVSLSNSNYELDTLQISKRVNSSWEDVSYENKNDEYSFIMPDSDVKITVTEKTSSSIGADPFTSKTSYQGNWSYYDGSYDYTMYYRIVFNGDSTLSWYLTFEAYDDGYYYTSSSSNLGPTIKKVIPSDMPSNDSCKEYHENISYLYHSDSDTITYTTKKGMTNIDATLQLNRNSSNEIISVQNTENLGGEYYQTKNKVLNLI